MFILTMLFHLQSAFTLNGTGLSPWKGNTSATFEAQFAALLADRDISSFRPTFIGALVRPCRIPTLSYCYQPCNAVSLANSSQ